MTESTCLHIQDRESGPIRVVELPWISVRIGRAAHCEVRLADHEVASEVCRLQRRGPSWRILPGKSESTVLLEGRRVGSPCLLPFDVPFRVGQYCLTLRQDRAAEPDWEIYSGPAPPPLAEAQDRTEIEQPAPARQAVAQPDPAGPTESAQTSIHRAIPHVADKHARVAKAPGSKQTPPPSRSSREPWDTRWKALGAHIDSRAEKNRVSPDIKRPAYQSEFKTVPLGKPRVPLIQPASPSRVQPAVSAVPTPAASSFEPAWDHAKVDSGWRDQNANVLTIAAPSQQSWRDWISPQSPIQAPPSHPEPVDREQPPAPEQGEILVKSEPLSPTPIPDNGSFSAAIDRELDPAPEQGGILVKSEPLPPTPVPDDDSFSAASVSFGESIVELAERVVERSQPESQISEIDHPTSLPDEPEAPKVAVAREVEWPSAKDILATHRTASMPRLPAANRSQATRRKHGLGGTPTLACVPAHWASPVWLSGPAAAFFVLATSMAGCVLSWSWARDSYTASIVTDRLLTTDQTAARSPLPDSVAPPERGWLTSTPEHLARWAILLGRLAGDANQTPEETTALLERALQASPINATARLASAQLDTSAGEPSVSLRSLGLSRDAASLAWTARRLLAAGKNEDALKLYGRSLSVALPSESSRAGIPRFSDDPGVPRYWLPGEEQVRDIVRELVSSNAWPFSEWSRVLPDAPIVLIAAARLLREKGSSDAEAVLDLILKEKSNPDAPETAAPVATAARAEAFALRSRWSEADQLYRQAIESIDDPTIQRSWWFNLADISYRLDNQTQRQAALRAALAVAYSDDITRRATDIQRATRARPVTRSPGVKAN